MDPVPQPMGTMEARTLPHNHFLLKIGLLIVVLIILATVFAGSYLGIPGLSLPLGDEQQAFVRAPEGLLVMAIAPKSKDSTARIFPVTYDFAQRRINYVPVDKLAASPEGVNLAYQHVFSGNGKFVAFVGAVDIDEISSFPETPMQIYRADVSQAVTYNDFVEKVQQGKQITDGVGVVRQAPSISNAGDVLYIAHRPESPALLFSSEAHGWDVHLVTQDGKDRTLTQGIYPKWVGNDRFVFLKDDGLYLYSIVDEREERVWGAQGVSTMRMGLEVSDDSQLLAWASPESGSVSIFQALNWGAGKLGLKGTIPVAGFRSAFSPDSRLVAVQTNAPISAEITADKIGTSVQYYDVETLRIVPPPFVLIGMDPNQTYLTDWRP